MDFAEGKRYNSSASFFRKKFDGRIQKVVVNAGFTCPNRDGSKGLGGCTFCDNDAFSPSYCREVESISRQIELGIEFHKVRYRRANRFLAYFQPYSNTYAPVEVLKSKYEEALSCPGVTGLVIGTRPDCVNDEILQYLSDLNKNNFIQVEYGIESIYEETLLRINRCHTYALGVDMIRRTKELGISTGAHFIFGLPGESLEMMKAYAPAISCLPLDNVKFHQLQIIRGTAMEKEYNQKPGDFHLFSLESYIDFIVSFIEELNPAISIERFAGEVPPRFIESKNWGLIRYDEVARRIEQELEKRGTWQGKKIVKL
ncbi:MAG: TIGR01212 family radical SAM protein [Bacteroidota bacterium]